jgi:hypothetical protein
MKRHRQKDEEIRTKRKRNKGREMNRLKQKHRQKDEETQAER